MEKNKYSAPLDSNGYAPSIMQQDLSRCYICGRSSEKLDRHEPFGGALRSKSKKMGLWVMLCHWTCHLNGAHAHGEIAQMLKREAQQRAMDYYGLTTDEWIAEWGKNFLD